MALLMALLLITYPGTAGQANLGGRSHASIGRICSDPYCTMCVALHARAAHGINTYRYSDALAPHWAAHNPTVKKPIPLAKERLPFEPTPTSEVKYLVRMVQPTSIDNFYDPGCGDARLLIALCKNSGATGVGLEINVEIADLARKKVKEAGLEKQIKIWTIDSRLVKLDKATTVVCYLFPDLLKQLDLANASQVLSYVHEVPGLTGSKWGKWWMYQKEIKND
jgi:hypothetical protein